MKKSLIRRIYAKILEIKMVFFYSFEPENENCTKEAICEVRKITRTVLRKYLITVKDFIILEGHVEYVLMTPRIRQSQYCLF